MATPYRRSILNAGIFGGSSPGFATTADLFSNTALQNAQDDNARYFAADRVRRLQRNPAIRAMKLRILSNAGFSPEEASEKADDPNFWRPEYQRLGIPRPYETQIIYGGDTNGIENTRLRNLENRRIRQDEKRVLERDDAIADLELDKELFELEKPLRRAEFQEEAAQRIALGGSKSLRAPSTKSSKPGQSDVATVNRESILGGGNAPIRRRAAPQLDMVAPTMATNLRYAKSYVDSSQDQVRQAQAELDSANEAYGLEKSAGMLSAAAIRNLNTAKRKVAEMQERLAQAADDYEAIAERAGSYGLEISGDNLFDAESGSVYKPKSFQFIPERAAVRPPGNPKPVQPTRLTSGQRALMETELNKIYKATPEIDEEEDSVNPIGIRARLRKQVLDGKGYSATPVIERTWDEPDIPATYRRANAANAELEKLVRNKRVRLGESGQYESIPNMQPAEIDLISPIGVPVGASASFRAPRMVDRNAGFAERANQLYKDSNPTFEQPVRRVRLVGLKPSRLTENDHYIVTRNAAAEADRLAAQNPDIPQDEADYSTVRRRLRSPVSGYDY